MLCVHLPARLPARSSEFKQVKELGRGGFSIVFRATHRIDGCEYALKRTKSPVSDNKERNAWLQVRPRAPTRVVAHGPVVRPLGS